MLTSFGTLEVLDAGGNEDEEGEGGGKGVTDLSRGKVSPLHVVAPLWFWYGRLLIYSPDQTFGDIRLKNNL